MGGGTKNECRKIGKNSGGSVTAKELGLERRRKAIRENGWKKPGKRAIARTVFHQEVDPVGGEVNCVRRRAGKTPKGR